jgi:hypothetical protein
MLEKSLTSFVAKRAICSGYGCAQRAAYLRRAGDKAIITSDGEFLGWIGGSCASRPCSGQKAIADEPRLVVLTPQSRRGATRGRRSLPDDLLQRWNSKIYIEPYLPAPRYWCAARPLAERWLKSAAVGFNVVLTVRPRQKKSFPPPT